MLDKRKVLSASTENVIGPSRQCIAVVLPDMRPGGAERVTLTLVRHFASMGFNIDLVVSSACGELLLEVPESVNLINLSAPRLRNLPLALARYFSRARPVAVLSVMQEINCIAVWARRLSGVRCRLVLTEHTHASFHIAALPNRRGRWLMPKAIRWSYPRADWVVAVSRGVASDLKKNVGLRNVSHSVIYNPIDIDRLMALSREQVDHPWLTENKSVPVLIAVGSLKKAKDFVTLIQALSLVRKTHEVRLIIVGEGSERPALERLVTELDLRESISFPGFEQNPWAWMAKADLFVSSSKWEGFQMVLIEALALGLPIVATDCPSGPYEILDGGRFGRLVPVEDPRNLACAIRHVLVEGGPDRLEAIARAEEYAAPGAVKKYLELLVPDSTG